MVVRKSISYFLCVIVLLIICYSLLTHFVTIKFGSNRTNTNKIECVMLSCRNVDDRICFFAIWLARNLFGFRYIIGFNRYLYLLYVMHFLFESKNSIANFLIRETVIIFTTLCHKNVAWYLSPQISLAVIIFRISL